VQVGAGNREHDLLGECVGEQHFLAAERARLAEEERDRADRFVVHDQRYREHSAKAVGKPTRARQWSGRVEVRVHARAVAQYAREAVLILNLDIGGARDGVVEGGGQVGADDGSALLDGQAGDRCTQAQVASGLVGGQPRAACTASNSPPGGSRV
jgi:hypothetical protein